MNASFYVPRLTLVLVFAGFLSQASAQYDDWKHTGSIYLVTDSAGADLPASAVEKNFPLLIRLNKEYFDFTQPKDGGEDVRFSSKGKPLAYQIERWDTKGGEADIWVRIPTIKGKDQQAIKMHWGNEKVSSESTGEQVFRTTEGFAAVWHLGDNLEDATSNNLDGVNRPDKPTVNTTGIIGDAQEFGVNQILVIRPPGAKSGRRVTCMPSGNADRTMSAWVNPTSFEGRNWAQASI
ncbi:MAG: DUF2341 domain-containing protein, partial [Opitutae bacterium]|nr:DUF2341 domain-containing protein [Opitutae bacterium]